MEPPVVEIENGVVSYREAVALRGVSFTVTRGEFVVVIGPNGAGKTTLLTVINGLTKLDRGQVLVLGLPLTGRVLPIIRSRVGYVAQAQEIDRRLPITVRETVMVGRYGRLGLLHRPGRADNEKVDDIIEMAGLGPLASRPLGHLSGGERQKTAIARALAQEPQVLLLDEPTTSLDRQARREVAGLVQSMHRAGGLTTICVTHDLDTIPPDCRRIVLMKEGRIVREGDPAAVLTSEALDELYGPDENQRGQICGRS